MQDGGPPVSPVTTLGRQLGRENLTMGRGGGLCRTGPGVTRDRTGGSRPGASGGTALWTAEPGSLDLQLCSLGSAAAGHARGLMCARPVWPL